MADVVAIYPRHGLFQELLRPGRPLPLGLLAACRHVVDEFDVAYIDPRLDRDWKHRLRRELEQEPLCVAMGVMLGAQIHEALRVSRLAKQLAPDVPVVWGGVHASLMPAQTLRHPVIDAVVCGEGEITFLELVRALRDGRPLHGIAGVAFLDDGEPVVNAERPFVALEQQPRLPYQLVDAARYSCSVSEPDEPGTLKLALETSRGCPHGCTFCYNPAYNRGRWRPLPADAVLDELAYLVDELGAATVDVVDDAFFTDTARARRIGQGILDRGLALRWFVQGARIDAMGRLSDADLALLYRSGLRVVRLGVESGSVRVLEAMNKGLSLDDVRALSTRLRRAGIAPWYYFTCGMPGETDDDLRRTVALLFELMEADPAARVVATFCVVPTPGTEVYRQARAAGAAGLPRRLEDWASVEMQLYAPWLDARGRERLERIFFCSLFIDRKAESMASSWVIRLFTRCYRPLARWRMRTLRFGWMPEFRLNRFVMRLWRARFERDG